MEQSNSKVYRDPRILIFQMAFMVYLVMFFTACADSGSDGGQGSGGGSQITCGTLAGTYIENFSADVLTINNDCTFTDSYCGYNASYTVPDQATGATTITVNGTNGAPGCMSSTAHACLIETQGNQLGINCDNGNHLYVFTKQ